VQLLFFENYLQSRNLQTKGKLSINYPQIVRIIRTKNLYLLRLKENLVVMADRSGFVKGSTESFEAFLRQKAPGADWKFRS